MSDDTKPVVGLVTIGPYLDKPPVDAPTLPEAISISSRSHVRPKSGRPTGRKPRDEDRKMADKIAIDAIEAALEEFELACVSAALTARQRACFVEHVAKLELAKRAVRR